MELIKLHFPSPFDIFKIGKQKAKKAHTSPYPNKPALPLSYAASLSLICLL